MIDKQLKEKVEFFINVSHGITKQELKGIILDLDSHPNKLTKKYIKEFNKMFKKLIKKNNTNNHHNRRSILQE